MNVMSRFFPSRWVVCVVILALGLSSASHATALSHGLGQAFPHAVNQSHSALWRVYVFERDGVRYVQINDSQGVVRAAFATANGMFLALPMGTDANHIEVPSTTSSLSRKDVQEEMCGEACNTNQIVSATRSSMAQTVAPITLSGSLEEKMCGGRCTTQGTQADIQTNLPSEIDAGSVIYQDATLQIRVTEDTQGHQVWRVIALPSAGK